MEREVLAITEMHKNITTSVRIDGERTEKLDVKVGVHLGSVLSPLLLFAMVMDEITKDVEKVVLRKLFMLMI